MFTLSWRGCEPAELIFWIGFGALVLPWLSALAWRVIRWLRGRRDGRGPNGEQTERSSREPNEGAGTDQLVGIEGIGPGVSAVLRRAGIGSYAELSAATPGNLRKILRDAGPQMATAEPMSWPLQARLLANGDIEGFRRFTAAMKGGVPRLEEVWGIGPALAEALREGGINSVTALAASPAETVQSLVPKAISPTVIRHWRDQARLLVDGEPMALLAAAGLPSRIAALDAPQEPGDRPGDEAQPGRNRWYLLSDELVDVLTEERGAPIWFPTRLTSAVAAGTMLTGLLTGLASANDLLPAPLQGLCKAPPATSPPPSAAPCLFDRTIGADALFEPGEAVLTAAGEGAIAQVVAAYLDRIGDAPDRDFVVFVTGHADRTGYSQEGGNEGLARRRAIAVRNAMQTEPRFGNAPIFTISAADAEPSGKTEQCAALASLGDRLKCYAPDRRVEIKIISLPEGEIPPAWKS